AGQPHQNKNFSVLNSKRGIGNAHDHAGFGADLVAALALVDQFDHVVVFFTEDNIDVFENNCIRHVPSPDAGRNIRSRMMARITMHRPASKPRAMLTVLSARTTGTPSPLAPTSAEMTTRDSESMIVWVRPAMICGMAKGNSTLRSTW